MSFFMGLWDIKLKPGFVVEETHSGWLALPRIEGDKGKVVLTQKEVY
jgi:hypothetical protein